MRTACVAIGALALAIACGSASADTEEKQRDVFSVGQALARCSAFFGFTAGIVKADGKASMTTVFQDHERGWKLAGIYMMRAGSKNPKFDSVQTAENISGAEMTRLKARLEGGDQLKDLIEEHQTACNPLKDLQVDVIQEIRRNSGK